MSRGYVVVAHLADGVRVESFATKSEARTRGMWLRRAGVVAFAYSATDYAKVSK